MSDDLKLIESITEDLNVIKKDLDSRKRLRDQLVGKLEVLLEGLLKDYNLANVELAEKELEIIKADIKITSVNCERQLVSIKQKIKDFDEQSAILDSK